MIALALVAALAAPADVLAPFERPPSCASLAKSGKLDEAERCYRDVGDTDAADVVAAYAASAPKLDDAAAHVDKPSVDFSAMLADGRAEGVVHATAAGAGAGFLAAATIAATTRASKNDSLPWLIAAPAVSALAGAGGSYALLDATKPTPSAIALSSSTMWAGATEGLLLQLAVFDKSSDVTAAPLRFATILGGGALGLGSGVLLSTSIAPSVGDVAVANSAFLWGGVLTGFGIGFLSIDHPSSWTTPEVAFTLLGGSLVPYAIALAAYPLLDIERGPSWLIEAGGAAGFLATSALLVIASTSRGINSGSFYVGVLGAGTAAGVVLGASAAYVVSEGIHRDATLHSATPPSNGPDVHAAPTALLDVKGNASPGLALAGSF
jgi:hypothetical protein